MPLPLKSSDRFGLTFRAVNDQDEPFLAHLYASTRWEEVAQTGWPVALQKSFLQQQHEAQHAHYKAVHGDAEWSIIEQNGGKIGRLYWRVGPSDIHIIDIALVPEARGGGIGTAILRDILDYGSELSKGVTIHVEQANPARSLYFRLGFQLVETRGLYDLLRAEPRIPSIEDRLVDRA